MKLNPSPYIQYMYGYPHKTAYRNFKGPIDLGKILNEQAGQEASLYFHIPFCRRKCGYCNLFSKAGCSGELIENYLNALRREAEQIAALTGRIHFNSFAIGGGTPLLLTVPQIEKVLDSAAIFGVTPANIFTSIETSPDQTTGETLQFLRNRGVERISIGIQSFQPEELKQLQRSISLQDSFRALEKIREANFPQFNIDLIYGIEGQTPQSLTKSIETALQYNPTELFIYPLYVRSGTTIQKRANDATYMQLYYTVQELLLQQGFRQTSMRRFVRNQTVDLEYSCGDETIISCGCGGRSYLGNIHTATPYAVHPGGISRILEAYITTTDFTHITHGICLSKEEQKRRFIIKNLLYYRGINRTEYKERFGSPEEVAEFTHLKEKEYITEKEGYIKLTPKGMAWSDYIGQLFISPAIRELMTTYNEKEYYREL